MEELLIKKYLTIEEEAIYYLFNSKGKEEYKIIIRLINSLLYTLNNNESEIDKLKEEKEELKNRLIVMRNYRDKLEKDLFENCENYVVNKETIRKIKKDLQIKCIQCNTDELQKYMDQIEILEELLTEERR